MTIDRAKRRELMKRKRAIGGNVDSITPKTA
jgi:hypothetical protein